MYGFVIDVGIVSGQTFGCLPLPNSIILQEFMNPILFLLGL